MSSPIFLRLLADDPLRVGILEGLQRPLRETVALPAVRAPVPDERPYLALLQHGEDRVRPTVSQEHLHQDTAPPLARHEVIFS